MRRSHAIAACAILAVLVARAGIGAHAQSALAPPPGPPPLLLPAPPPSAGAILAAGVADRGEAVYIQWCAGCHAPLPKPGGPMAGRFPPAGSAELQRRYEGKLPATLTERRDLSAAMIRTVVRNGQGIMPPTRKSEITNEELTSLSNWLVRKQVR